MNGSRREVVLMLVVEAVSVLLFVVGCVVGSMCNPFLLPNMGCMCFEHGVIHGGTW